MWTLPLVKNGSTKKIDGSNGEHSLIELHDVVKNYKTAVGDFPALKGVDLNLNAGEFVSVIGKSGSGKTTLINMIAGIDRPTCPSVVRTSLAHTLALSPLRTFQRRFAGSLTDLSVPV